MIAPPGAIFIFGLINLKRGDLRGLQPRKKCAKALSFHIASNNLLLGDKMKQNRNKKKTTGWVQIAPSPFSIKTSDKEKRIELYQNIMKKSMKSKRPRLSLKAMKLMRLWNQYRATTRPNDSGSGGTGDIDVLFLRWLLYGRALKFYNYILKSTKRFQNNSEKLAICNSAYNGINRVYRYNWPHNIYGYMFHQLWGWAQLELKKPGENGPPSIKKQKEMILQSYPDCKEEDIIWQFIGFGGITGRKKESKNG
ncbi:hypothetical protein CL659_06105 [bacterium]|nr:hypothetical protein [bacterium]